MSSFHAGQTVRVIADEVGHGFEIGAEVMLTEPWDEPGTWLTEVGWYVSESDIEPLADEPDPVHEPAHYKQGVPGDYEVIDVIRAQGWENNWYMASAAKYLLRAQYKGSYKQDIRKAIRMLEWELQRDEEQA